MNFANGFEALTIARANQISLEHTPYYHCTTRCVRRAFLCGDDHYTGQNFDHRKQWMEDRLALLSSVFAIDLLAYAIMSNHYHVVVRVNHDATLGWSDEEVVERWGQIFKTPQAPSPEMISRWRWRLGNLSWYMRCVNEPLARAANREDKCKGRFWQGRFHCQALLDEIALLKCMVYVDLNPIRAKVADSPETSTHTSIKARIDGRDAHLLPMLNQTPDTFAAVPIRSREYLQLVDWSGRHIHPRKPGRITVNLPPILERTGFSGSEWIREMTHYGRWYFRAVGSLANLNRYCRHLGQQWLKAHRKATPMTP